MPLVDVRGFDLNPNVLSNFKQGVQDGAQFAQFNRGAQVRDLLSKAQAPKDGNQQFSQQDRIKQAQRVDPVIAAKMLNDIGLTDSLKRAEASRFSAQLQGVPFEQRASRIQARAESLQSQNRNAKDTLELLDMSETDQNTALQNIELADLSTRERVNLRSKQQFGGGLASAKTVINDDGSSIQGLPSGEVVVRNPSGQIVTGQERLDVLNRSKQSKQSTLQQEADRVVKTASGTEGVKLKARRTSNIIKEISDRNRASSRAQGTLRKALKLAQKATQGVSGAVKLQLSRLIPGIDSSDEGALDAALKELSLVQLQQFKGPTTDFEFAVTQDISGSLGQGKQANIARIKSLDRNEWFNRREAVQFREFVRDGGNPDEFSFDFDKTIKTKRGDISMQDLQDTAVENTLTIQETLKELNK